MQSFTYAGATSHIFCTTVGVGKLTLCWFCSTRHRGLVAVDLIRSSRLRYFGRRRLSIKVITSARTREKGYRESHSGIPHSGSTTASPAA